MWQKEKSDEESKFFITWIDRPSNKHTTLPVTLGSGKGIRLQSVASNGNDSHWCITIDNSKPAKMTAFRFNN
jgi:hypothetical protein